jgi:hypothetical protein
MSDMERPSLQGGRVRGPEGEGASVAAKLAATVTVGGQVDASKERDFAD